MLILKDDRMCSVNSTDRQDSKHIRNQRSPCYMDSGSRFREIDATRGIAILMMIVFHTVFDLNFFMIAPVNVATGFWRYFAMATASLFLFVVGISLVVSHARSAAKLSGFALTKKFLVPRGGYLRARSPGYARHVAVPARGIHHFRHPAPDRRLGDALAALFPVREIQYPPRAALHCGRFFYRECSGPDLASPDSGSIPHRLPPLTIRRSFPGSVRCWWESVWGNSCTAGGVRRFTAPHLPDLLVRPLAFLGRHSLLIYLVHQPVIILLLAAVTGTKVL